MRICAHLWFHGVREKQNGLEICVYLRSSAAHLAFDMIS